MPDISQATWSETDAGNNATPPDGWPENQAPSTVNDCARMMMGAIKRFWDRVNPAPASTGSANAYVLTPAASLGAYATGEVYAFRAGFANTGAATLDISALGAKAIKKYAGGAKLDLAAGDIASGQPVQLAYDGTDMVLTSAGPLPPLDGYLYGLALANNAGDAANDIDIAAGRAWSEAAAGGLMTLAAALTKRLDAAWAVGTNQGGLDTGSKAASTWYHLHLIRRPDTGVVDALFSTSASAPAMPSGYTQRRRLGAVVTDGSATIRAFRMFGDEVRFTTSIEDVNLTGLSVDNGTLRSISVPLGVEVEANLCVGVQDSGGATRLLFVSRPGEADTGNGAVLRASAGTLSFGAVRVRSNVSRQIQTALGGTGSASGIVIVTRGWIDTRGK